MDDFGIRDWLNHISAMFNVGLDSLTIRDFVKNFEISAIAKLMENLKVDNVRIGYLIPDAHVQAILEKTVIKTKLIIPSSSKIQPTENLKLDMEELRLESSSWLKLDFLLTINCQFIEMGWSNWTDEDLNLFLKSWINGGNPKLKMLQAKSDEGKLCDREKILNGLEAVECGTEKVFHLKTSNFSRDIKVEGSFEIQRKNQAASVIVKTIGDIQTNFMFLVWP